MNVLFYSPFAKADGLEPSGAARMADLLVQALRGAGATVSTPRLPRTFDGRGDEAFQNLVKIQSGEAAAALLLQIERGQVARPDVWFSYHVYYKSPDWIGPRVARELGIAYVIAEGSYAPKRNGGPWNTGHVSATEALKSADLLLAMTRFDQICLVQLCPGRVQLFVPFIDVSSIPLRVRPHRKRTRLIAVGMMRNTRKFESYRILADAMGQFRDISCELLVAGDGEFRDRVERLFDPLRDVHDIVFLGTLTRDALHEQISQSDIFVWPGIGEAYGLTYLEAQACGLPVVACRERGVVDVTLDRDTALLCSPDDATSVADNIRRLAVDTDLRERMSAQAQAFVRSGRTLEAASARLKAHLDGVVR